jgi:DNA-binding transcriptional regulator YhcF (GntR family)
MSFQIEIDKSIKVPIYQQITDLILKSIESGALRIGDMLPSINQVARENSVARETVIKSFSSLQEHGIVQPVQGKGFFIMTKSTDIRNRVFLLFDTFSAYKQTFYKGLRDSLGPNSFVDLYFHHFNPKIFKKLLHEALGNYTHYVVLPFDYPEISDYLKEVPEERLYLTDRYPDYLKDGYSAVYQKFDDDIYNALIKANKLIKKYNCLTLVFCDTITEVPVELKKGFERYCMQYGVKFQVSCGISKNENIRKGDSFLIIDDDDLVRLVEIANERKLIIGQDIGIISYNEIPLKKVIGKGISVISTDFKKMGETIAKLIIDNERACIQNPCRFIDRGSF